MEDQEEISQKEFEKLLKVPFKRDDRKIVIKEHTLWSKTEISVLAFFIKNSNRPSTYMEIARAYVSASYSNYKRACEDLVKRSYLERLKNGKFRVRKDSWEEVKAGKQTPVDRRLPFLDIYLKKVRKVSKAK
ncbi:Uncharacterised protein [uncultured archaeon]|nr:Uncharacterised protein [uncultured archaeon]